MKYRIREELYIDGYGLKTVNLIPEYKVKLFWIFPLWLPFSDNEGDDVKYGTMEQARGRIQELIKIENEKIVLTKTTYHYIN